MMDADACSNSLCIVLLFTHMCVTFAVGRGVDWAVQDVAQVRQWLDEDDILLPPCPVATEELLLCLHVDKSVRPQVTHPFGRCRHNIGQIHLLGVGHHRRVARGSMPSEEGLRHPCTRNRIEVEAQLHRFSTVLDVVNRVLEIQRSSWHQG